MLTIGSAVFIGARTKFRRDGLQQRATIESLTNNGKSRGQERAKGRKYRDAEIRVLSEPTRRYRELLRAVRFRNASLRIIINYGGNSRVSRVVHRAED